MTVLCDCEAIMNSRPITYLSDSDPEFLPLTPAMFLQEIEETGVPDLDTADTGSLNKRLLYLQNLRKNLRQRFRSEYLGQLVQRTNNINNTKPTIEIGEIVLVGSDNLKRVDWPIARVLEITPGRDGVARIVRLQSAKGELVRPVQKVYPLEVTKAEKVDLLSKIPSKN